MLMTIENSSYETDVDKFCSNPKSFKKVKFNFSGEAIYWQVECEQKRYILRKGYIMNTPNSETTTQWAAQWLDGVADGSNTMSQRKLSSIETRGGGLDAVKALAEQKGVHLLLLEDDKGEALVAASTKPFSVVC